MQAQITQEAAKRGMTPQQFQLWQRQQMEADAKKAGLSFDEYINRLKQHALETHQRKQQLAQQQQAAEQSGQPQIQQGKSEQQVPITPGAPDPKALALAKWMRGQDLKTRTCILNGQRKDMFRGMSPPKPPPGASSLILELNPKSVKRALRALQSPAYAAASSKKNSLLPLVTPEQPVQEIFKLLPLSLLALRVSKADPHEGHDHGPSTSKKPQKRVKGLWHVKIEPQQDIDEELHYIWLYEGPQWKQKLYAAGALVAIMALVMFPLWPIKLRLGVWYLSMGVLGLIGLFTLMSIFRLILFCITYFAVPPGLWLYPNLFEDVGFFDSFRPLWGWQEVGSFPISPPLLPIPFNPLLFLPPAY